MAKENGSIFFLNVDGNPVGATTSFSWSASVDLPDTTTRDSGGFAEHLTGGGLRTITGSCDGFQDPAATVSTTELYALISGRADFTCLIIPEANGTKGFTGEATISDLEITYDMEQPVALSFSFQVNGSWTEVTQS